MIDALAAIVAVFLIIVVAGAIIPIVIHSRGLERRVSALEEARRGDLMDELKQPAGAPPAPPWWPRPLRRRRRMQ